MQSDEQEIRQLVSTWMEATKAGEVDRVLSLIADDAIFLVPGHPVMRKPDFAAALRAQSAAGGPKVEGASEIQEIKVMGDWAFMWSTLTVTMTPPGGPRKTRRGNALTVLEKKNGRWMVARDANLLAPDQA